MSPGAPWVARRAPGAGALAGVVLEPVSPARQPGGPVLRWRLPGVGVASFPLQAGLGTSRADCMLITCKHRGHPPSGGGLRAPRAAAPGCLFPGKNVGRVRQHRARAKKNRLIDAGSFALRTMLPIAKVSC